MPELRNEARDAGRAAQCVSRQPRKARFLRKYILFYHSLLDKTRPRGYNFAIRSRRDAARAQRSFSAGRILLINVLHITSPIVIIAVIFSVSFFFSLAVIKFVVKPVKLFRVLCGMV